MAKSKCGPVVTDNGNFILDWYLPKEGEAKGVLKEGGEVRAISQVFGNIVILKIQTFLQHPWAEVHSRLLHTPGVVETGLFVGMAKVPQCTTLSLSDFLYKLFFVSRLPTSAPRTGPLGRWRPDGPTLVFPPDPSPFNEKIKTIILKRKGLLN